MPLRRLPLSDALNTTTDRANETFGSMGIDAILAARGTDRQGQEDRLRRCHTAALSAAFEVPRLSRQLGRPYL